MILCNSQYLSIKENSVGGRYVVHDQIDLFLKKIEGFFKVQTVGKSVKGKSIKKILLGTGEKKILMWSQMHGNESTTTKAVLDLLNFLGSGSPDARTVLENCTITIIPLLNPDGAETYTRVNANGVDLNRDAQQRTQPESVALRTVFDEFQPDYCFNLHDQRTIFNVGNTSKTATVSFLAPAHDEIRSISPSRARSMQLIVAMNRVLQQSIPGQIGRYDDAFNANCIGDTFQMTGTPTVLFEAGHYPDDYDRERTREYIFHALMTALQTICEGILDSFDPSDYFTIPENQKLFFDVLIYNVDVIDPSASNGSAVGILYSETLQHGAIEFRPEIQKKGDLSSYFGHKTYNCLNRSDLLAIKERPYLKVLFPSI